MTKRIWTTAVLATTLGMASMVTGCRSDAAAAQQAPIVDGNDANDPAAANLANANMSGSMQPVYAAPGGGPRAIVRPVQTRVAGQAYSAPVQSSGQSYAGSDPRNEAYNYNQQPPAGQANSQQQYDPADDDQLYSDLLDPNVPVAQQAPPPLPVYQQPVAPGPDYLWTPGYWNYSNAGYYYVPGNWVSAPFVGALWTPGWWGYTGRGYGWHHGYWGRHVGYYGGVNYGFGFIGIGYQGGYWNNDHFYYNRNVNHVEPGRVNNYVYDRRETVVNNTYVNNSRVSYFGGPGGLGRRPVQAEIFAQRETHIAPLGAQIAARREAEGNRQQFFSANGGHPQTLFAAHPVIELNVNVPAALQIRQNFAVEQQRLGEQQQRFQQQQQFRNQEQLQRQHQQVNDQLQRRQVEQNRQQQNEQLRNQEQQQRQQQTVADQQQRRQFDLQRQQQNQQQNQQREQQANLQQQQRQQFDRQRAQQQQQLRNQDQQRQQQTVADQQQRQLEQEGRMQSNLRRQPGVDRQFPGGQVNAQHDGGNAQGDQAGRQRSQQQELQRQQFDQQRQQQDVQRAQQMQQQRQQMDVQRQQMESQRQMQRQQDQPQRMAPQTQPQQHSEVPRAAPASPHVEGPHPGGGERHGPK